MLWSLRSSWKAFRSSLVKLLTGFFARRIASHILMRAISFSWPGAFEDCRADSMGAAKSMLFNFGTMAYFGPFARTDFSPADN